MYSTFPAPGESWEGWQKEQESKHLIYPWWALEVESDRLAEENLALFPIWAIGREFPLHNCPLLIWAEASHSDLGGKAQTAQGNPRRAFLNHPSSCTEWTLS